jgi:DNA-binding CsgD family transcriptional regulator
MRQFGVQVDAEHKAQLVVLSPRERQVLRLVMSGASNKQVAFRLGIAFSTVKAHVASLTAGARVANRVELSLWALSHPEVFAGSGAAPGLHHPGCACAALYCTVARLAEVLEQQASV